MTDKKYTISRFSNDEKRSAYAEATLDLTFGELARFVISSGWSPSTFQGLKRHNSTFVATDLLVLDVDGGCTLGEAPEKFAGFKAIIAPSRNHQRQKVKKSGEVQPACDRFRVIIPFRERISSAADYQATWFAAKARWAFIDDACKDPARFYFACKEIVLVAEHGQSFPVSKASDGPKQKKNEAPRANQEKQGDRRGTLSRHTLEFIASGAPDGEWHAALYKASIDLKQNWYSEQEAIELLSKAATNPQKCLDEHDLELIRDVYLNRTPRYAPRWSNGVRQQFHQVPYQRMTQEERMMCFERDRKLQDEAVRKATTFVHPDFDPYYRLMMGLTLVGACSGSGKSTSAAHLVHRFLADNPGKQVLYISNEESTSAVLGRIACLDLGKNFLTYHLGQMSPEDAAAVDAKARELILRVEVVDKQGFDMTRIEDVKAVLEAARTSGDSVGLVVLDYLQTIYQSGAEPNARSFEVSKNMGHFLKEYGRSVAIPVVVFGQLKPKSEVQDISARFCNDKTIYHHAVGVIEVKPDFETKRTEFIVHKARFGTEQGRSVFLRFNCGQFETMPEAEMLSLLESIKRRRSSTKDAAPRGSDDCPPKRRRWKPSLV